MQKLSAVSTLNGCEGIMLGRRGKKKLIRFKVALVRRWIPYSLVLLKSSLTKARIYGSKVGHHGSAVSHNCHIENYFFLCEWEFWNVTRLKSKRFKKSIYDVNVRETVIRLAHTCHPMSRVQVSKGNQSTSSKTQSKYTTLLLRCDFFYFT